MEILIVFILILLNGIFSMSEIALVSSRRARLEAALKLKKPGAQTALDLVRSPTQFLSTVQIGITLIGLLTGIYSGESITNDLENWLVQFEPVRSFADGLAVAIVLLCITYSTLVLGELVPKRIGLSNPEAISIRIAPFMKFLSWLTFPFVWILTHTSDLILRILGIKPSKKVNITEEEIKANIQESMQGGEIQKIEQDIVERVFSLGDRRIGSLMTTRPDLVFINIDDDFNSIRTIIAKELHRIYPVYENSKDEVVGVLALKDLFLQTESDKINVRDLVKPAHFLSENMSAYSALERFKTSKVHYALVTNEYGLVLGIVTMDDILLALVGDVSDFYSEGYQLVQRQDGSWIVDGQYPLAEFMMRFEMELSPELEGINTIGGLILQELNHIPIAGEKISWNGLEIEVLDVDHVKIDKVLVTKK